MMDNGIAIEWKDSENYIINQENSHMKVSGFEISSQDLESYITNSHKS